MANSSVDKLAEPETWLAVRARALHTETGSIGKAAIPTIGDVCASGPVDYAAVIRYADALLTALKGRLANLRPKSVDLGPSAPDDPDGSEYRSITRYHLNNVLGVRVWAERATGEPLSESLFRSLHDTWYAYGLATQLTHPAAPFIEAWAAMRGKDSGDRTAGTAEKAGILSTITIKGFKSIGSVENLATRPINVLIGANGSGKSNFLGVFKLLQTIREGRLQNHVAHTGGADRILHFGAKVTEVLAIHVSFGDGSTQYEIMLEATGEDRLSTSEVIHFWHETEHQQSLTWLPVRLPGLESGNLNPDTPHLAYRILSSLEAGISNPELRRVEAPWGLAAAVIQDHLERWRVYHFLDTGANSPIKKDSDLHDNRYLRPDGANLAAFLYLLREQHASSYDLIRRTVRLVAPFFEDFWLEPLEPNPDKIRLEWRHKGSDAYFDASSLSDGTLRFMALATLLLQPEALRPSVILVDEPALGLHPYALELLASLVKQAAVKSRVILATQSPILLDHFDPEDVLVTDLVEGQTTFRRLDADDLEVWLEEYSLGQLWEKNELGGRPASA